MAKTIYADNAATTKLDRAAFETMIPWLTEDYGNASQPYSFARKPKKALTEAREMIAECIGALPDEVFFTSGGTESDNWALKSFGLETNVRKAITSEIEHHAVLNASKGAIRLPVDSEGIVSPKTLEDVLTSDNTTVPSGSATLVSVMLVNNEIGTIEPVKELAAIAHAHAALFHTDAVQAVGHIPIDVKDLCVDMLSASAHKFNGPKGIGFLYIRKGVQLRPFMDGGAQESQRRAGTENIASIVGMAIALKKSCDEMQNAAKKLRTMENIFLDTLRRAGVDFIRNGAEHRVPGNVNISVRGVSGEMLLHRLDLKGISISTGSACDSVNTQVSHVVQAIGVPHEYAKGTIRVSFGRDNVMEDAAEIAEAIVNILRNLKI